jgi:ferric-dicitrate binding protein FerR (iron transport regulator)
MPTNLVRAGADIQVVVEEAAEWYLRCTSGELTTEEAEQFLQWLLASPGHALELANIPWVDALMGWHFALEGQVRG